MIGRRSDAGLLATFLLLACADEDPGKASVQRERPLVYTTIHPLQFFVTRIAGDLVDCEVALPAGLDPRHWVPDRKTLERLAAADLVVFHGADLEGWRRMVGLPRSRQSIVCTGFDEHFLKIEGAVTHIHGGEAHTHDGIDPNLWLDLRLAGREARVVARALNRLLPDHTATFDRNLESLERELSREHAAHAKLELRQKRVGATERLYDYWARSHGVEIVDLNLSHAAVDADQSKTTVPDFAARIVLCPREPDERLQAKIDRLGLTAVVFDPCFTVGAGQDFLTVMAANRARLERALR